MRVFLDTNVVVAALATRGLGADVLQLVLAEHTLVVGEAVLAELGPVLSRKVGLPPELVSETEELLRREGEVVREAAPLTLDVPDADDGVILGQATAAAVDVLVTGDRDLLGLAEGAPVRILSPRGFWEHLRSL